MDIFGNRVRRIAVGATLTVGGTIAWLAPLMTPLASRSPTLPRAVAAVLAAATWIVAASVDIVARRRPTLFVRNPPPESLSSLSPRAQALARRSVALPLVGVIVAVPPAMHVLWEIAFDPPREFLESRLFAVIVLVVAQLVLICSAVAFSRDWPQLSPRHRRSSGWWALFVATMASYVPGLFLMLLPPFVVFPTFAWFVPLAFRCVAVAVEREQRPR
jgi:hypothetical protein